MVKAAQTTRIKKEHNGTLPTRPVVNLAKTVKPSTYMRCTPFKQVQDTVPLFHAM